MCCPSTQDLISRGVAEQAAAAALLRRRAGRGDSSGSSRGAGESSGSWPAPADCGWRRGAPAQSSGLQAAALQPSWAGARSWGLPQAVAYAAEGGPGGSGGRGPLPGGQGESAATPAEQDVPSGAPKRAVKDSGSGVSSSSGGGPESSAASGGGSSGGGGGDPEDEGQQYTPAVRMALAALKFYRTGISPLMTSTCRFVCVCVCGQGRASGGAAPRCLQPPTAPQIKRAANGGPHPSHMRWPPGLYPRAPSTLLTRTSSTASQRAPCSPHGACCAATPGVSVRGGRAAAGGWCLKPCYFPSTRPAHPCALPRAHTGNDGYDPTSWPPVGLAPLFRLDYSAEVAVVLGAALVVRLGHALLFE